MIFHSGNGYLYADSLTVRPTRWILGRRCPKFRHGMELLLPYGLVAPDLLDYFSALSNKIGLSVGIQLSTSHTKPLRSMSFSPTGPIRYLWRQSWWSVW